KLRLEETDDVESSALARKPFKKPGLKVNRLPQLLLEGPSLNDDVEVPSFNAEKEKETTYYAVSESNEEDVNEDENGSESNKEAANEDETGSESSESDDSKDNDYIVDEDNVINEVDVDMQEFYQNIDKDVEWVGPSKGNVEVPAQVDVEEGFDLDDFDMDIDCDSDVESSKERKRALRALRKESKIKHGHFYVGQEFADKKEATTLVSCQAVATRRKLYVWKNDKLRVMVVCRGKCPNSVGPNASGLNSPNKGGKKGSYVYNTIACPWSLQISKENNTWTVKTYKDEHTCLQTREVKLLTDKWLSNQIEDIVKPNPSILVKALKEQLQKKYQVGISIGKVKRIRAASIIKVKGDFSEQYSLLRDYVLELQRTNEDTTVKIDLEIDYNPSETTRHFKRIYVCIGALKRGFKEGLRDLLGLDGCFIKGQYPSQLLASVGIDVNYGDDLDLNPMSNFTFISDRQKVLSATTVPYFDKQIGKLKNLDEGRAHCDVLLNNLCEVFNRQLLDGRDVPIITCLEFVREYLMKRIVNVKKVLWNGGTKYQASGPYEDHCVVDMEENNCSCRKWELTGMPCKHAVAVINEMTITNVDVGVLELWIGRPPKSRKKSASEISSQKMSANGKLSRVGKSVTYGKYRMKGHIEPHARVLLGDHKLQRLGDHRLQVLGDQRHQVLGD
ncbi:mutator type transposase, partial [Tanacetum coccineum]